MIFQTQIRKTNDAETIELLVSELAEALGSRTSEIFWRKAIRLLGVGLVREALGEVRMRRTEITNPGGYFTQILVNWMSERGLYAIPSGQSPADLNGIPKPFPLIREPETKEIEPEQELQQLQFPFSPDLIQWLVFVGPEYFTLTNEKATHDRVENVRIDVKGRSYEVGMLRGKFHETDQPRGILTSEHMRVLGAIERIWADRRGPHSRIGQRCVVNVTLPDIARYMGIRVGGGREYEKLRTKVHDLGSTGYCYLLGENPELRTKGLKDLSFRFFGEVTSITIEKDGLKTTGFQIVFSKQFSAALLARDRTLVSRPVDMLTIRGDIALKLYVYLYRILMSRAEHSIELSKLLLALGLKRTGWWLYKSQRKREVEKAIREVNGRTTHDGRVFDVRILEGLDKADFLLHATLKESP